MKGFCLVGLVLRMRSSGRFFGWVSFFLFPTKILEVIWAPADLRIQRFRSYGLSLDGAGPDVLAWMAKVWNDPVFKALGDRYYAQAEDPQTCIPHYDDIFRDRDDVQYGLFPRDWTFSVSG
jgi:hypothetical protein